MSFNGQHALTIDVKNRLSIPFAIRKKLSDEVDGHSFYILPGRRPDSLHLYAEKFYDRVRKNVMPAYDELSDQAYEYRLFVNSQIALLEPDSQGRVLIPERLLKRAGIGKEVLLVGMEDHLELWDRGSFEKFEDRMWPEYTQQRAAVVQELKTLASTTSVEGQTSAGIFTGPR
jgi:MraZ protein